MSLKTYKNTEIQDFTKFGSGDLLLGLQKSNTFKFPEIYDAYTDSSNSIAKIELVRINKNGKEIDRTILDNSVLKVENGQILINEYYIFPKNLAEQIYYLEFNNGFDIFKTDPFLIKEMNTKITADITFLTADNNIIRVNDTNIII